MVNRVVLVGRLTKDAEMKKTQNGISVVSFSIAVNRRVSKQYQQDNPNAQTVDYINCIAWRQTADIIATYTKKGSLVAIEGKVQSRTYDDAQGTRHYVTEVQVDSLDLLESKNSSQKSNESSEYNSTSYQPQQNQNSQSITTGNSINSHIDISDDDLPF